MTTFCRYGERDMGEHEYAYGRNLYQSSLRCTCYKQYEKLQELHWKFVPFPKSTSECSLENLNGCLLSAQIINSEFSIWDTSAVTRLDVRLVLTISITPCWTSTHW